jgi:hypothetical protein
MELVSKVVLLSIVKSIISSPPVKIATAAFNRGPFGLVLTSNLVPECIILWNTTTGFYISSGSDVTKKLVGIRR